MTRADSGTDAAAIDGTTIDTTTIDTMRLTYTVEEVARLLNLSRGITYQYVRDGVIPAERIGRRWLIPRKRLHAWLDGQAA